ncbi:response regulator [Shewanella intestini]|uniref:Response regulator n=1 Tax=Shewanella intestini TaxID=2017544 RepID=A0ABS5HZT0_9GAMM|nr:MULTISPECIES: response regulator [Shewanella]MBR9727297.1 response regulator [Shewanella intestini]MRG35653.1 response regulator [Shewanella sp. XMDDZSB0408]
MALTDVAVLLVEDDPVFRQLVADFLAAQGAVVNIANDGEQGVDLFNRQHFDIVIADLCMPVVGGLDMLKQMVDINPAIPAIVISGNDAMADVVEALRIGASDYLVKPVTDLFMIEQAVEQALLTGTKAVEQHVAPQSTELIDLSYQELNDNLLLLEQSAEAAKSVQQQLFPSSAIEYPQALIHYTLYKNNDVSAYFIDSTMVGDKHLILYMAHFMPEDNSAAFGCVLLRSFVNQQLKRYRNGQSHTLIRPAEMLEYLNERMVNSGLHILMDIIYVCLDVSEYRISIAQSGKGLRCYLRNEMGLTPLAIPDTAPIGFPSWYQPSIQFRHLSIGEQLCIGTHQVEHKQALLENQFEGLIFDNKIKAGGFMQLECE